MLSEKLFICKKKCFSKIVFLLANNKLQAKQKKLAGCVGKVLPLMEK